MRPNLKNIIGVNMSFKRGLVLKLVVYVLCIMFASASYAEAQIIVSDAWIRELPPGSSVTAGYMMIENLGNTDDKLTGINSTFAGHAGIHTTQIDDNGIARMEMLDELIIPAGTKVVLEPGGKHIMLTDITQPVKKGDALKLELMFEGAGRKEIYMKVRGLSGD